MKQTPRFYLGLACLALSLILPLFGLLVARLPLSLAAKATIIGLLTVGGRSCSASWRWSAWAKKTCCGSNKSSCPG